MNTLPFLKWPGGKQWIAPKLAVRLALPKGATYYEPFLGGGALFFALGPSKAVLGDVNESLVEAFFAVQSRPDLVLRYLRPWNNCSEEFYAIRRSNYRSLYRRAAQFVFLNRTCWGGMYRVNQAGEFNVPYAGYNDRGIVSRERILDASHCLEAAVLRCADFEEIVKGAGSGDLVYFDPPYTTRHDNNGFRRYNERLFSWRDQERLAEVAARLAVKGCCVVVSNANHSDLKRLYSSFHILEVSRSCRLPSDPRHRCHAHEAIFSSHPLTGV